MAGPEDQFGPPAQVNTAPPVKVGPPENEQEYSSRVQGWEDTLNRIHEIAKDPQTRSFLFTLGANLIRDRPKSASTIGHVGTSLLEAQDASSREGERQFNQANQTRKTSVAEDRNLIARESSASRGQESELNRRQQLDVERERTSLTTSLAKIAGTRDTEQHEARMSVLDRQLAATEARLALARQAGRDTSKLENRKLDIAEKRIKANLDIAGVEADAEVHKFLAELETQDLTMEQLVLLADTHMRSINPERQKKKRAHPVVIEQQQKMVQQARDAGFSEEQIAAHRQSHFNEKDVAMIMQAPRVAQPVQEGTASQAPPAERPQEAVSRDVAAGRNKAQAAARKIASNVSTLSGNIALGAHTGTKGGDTLEEELGPDWRDQIQQQVDLLETLKETPQMRTGEVEIIDETVEKLKSYLKRFGGIGRK